MNSSCISIWYCLVLILYAGMNEEDLSQGSLHVENKNEVKSRFIRGCSNIVTRERESLKNRVKDMFLHVSIPTFLEAEYFRFEVLRQYL